MNRAHHRFLSLVVAVMLPFVAARATELQLAETVQLARASHPQMQANAHSTEAAQYTASARRAQYLPSLALQALVPKGFPGSAGFTDVGGVMVSPFHHGASVGLMFKEDLMDIGRTAAAAEVADRHVDRELAKEKLDSSLIPLAALAALIDCAEGKSGIDDFKNLVAEVSSIEKEATHFFATGQRTEVDAALARSQRAEVETLLESFEIKQRSGRVRLEKLLTAAHEAYDCPSITSLFDEVRTYRKSDSSLDPQIRFAQTEMDVAQARIRSARMQFLPKLTVIGSLGAMEGSELGIPLRNWSYAIGLSVPIFDMVRISDEVDAAKHEYIAKQKEFEAARYQSDEWRRIADENENELSARVNNLKNEEDLSRKAYEVARKRYRLHQGTLIELREALRAWFTAENQRIHTTGQFLWRKVGNAVRGRGH